MQSRSGATSCGSRRARATRWELVRYFLKRGTIGFGGPVALVGYIRRISSRRAATATSWGASWHTGNVTVTHYAPITFREKFEAIARLSY
jgi:hypothetical protein